MRSEVWADQLELPLWSSIVTRTPGQTQARPRPDSGNVLLAHSFLHERDDPCLVVGGQLLQRIGDRPHGAVVEVRAVVEAKCRIPRLELGGGLEEADNLAIPGI